MFSRPFVCPLLAFRVDLRLLEPRPPRYAPRARGTRFQGGDHLIVRAPSFHVRRHLPSGEA
eukprot:1987400-Alexandrium_andersonii.AAC.1